MHLQLAYNQLFSSKWSLDGGIIINCPFLSVPLVGVGKLIIGSVFHTWMLKQAPASAMQVSDATRCQMRQAEASKPSLKMRQGPSGQPVADEG